MKRLIVVIAFLLPGMGLAADPGVAQCFKVKALLKMDSDHYWADWKNACPYTIDSVYITVEFADRVGKSVGNGLWALHLVMPGLARIIRLSAPETSADFDHIRVRGITTDLEQALGRASPAR